MGAIGNIIDGIGLFFGYIIFHALPPLIWAAVAGAAVGLFFAHLRREWDRRKRIDSQA